MNEISHPTRLSAEILIVEDSPTQSLRIRYLLESAGYRVALSANGQQAIEAAARRKPDLIISDINMPLMDGFELCARVKADPRMAHLPVILTSPLSDPGYLVRCLECGADQLVAKPYEPEYILERVRYSLLNANAPRSATRDPEMELVIEGRRYLINASREQLFGLLFSSYAAAQQRNKELLEAKELFAAHVASQRFNVHTYQHVVSTSR